MLEVKVMLEVKILKHSQALKNIIVVIPWKGLCVEISNNIFIMAA